MEADKCIATSSVATSKNQLTINDLDDDTLGMIFNKLPYIERVRTESVCQRWYDASKENWCIYSKRLIIDLDDLRSSSTEKNYILEKILQRSGPYLEEIICMPFVECNEGFSSITIKRIAELCPKLKRLNAGTLMLNDDDWLAFSNLEAFSFYPVMKVKGDELSLLLSRNKRLRRLEIFDNLPQDFPLLASNFDHLNPGQLEVLHIEYCRSFDFTAEVADKLAESLVEFSYSIFQAQHTSRLQHLGKLKNLRSLDLRVEISSLETDFIADIVQNCWKIERFFLAFSTEHEYNQNIFAPLFDLPHLKRLVIIVDKDEISRVERDKLVQRASHLEFFVIDTFRRCIYGPSCLYLCNLHRRDEKKRDAISRFRTVVLL